MPGGVSQGSAELGLAHANMGSKFGNEYRAVHAGRQIFNDGLNPGRRQSMIRFSFFSTRVPQDRSRDYLRQQIAVEDGFDQFVLE